MSNISKTKEQLGEARPSVDMTGDPKRLAKAVKTNAKFLLDHSKTVYKRVSDLDVQYTLLGNQIETVDDLIRQRDQNQSKEVLEILDIHREIDSHLSELNDLFYRLSRAASKVK